MSQLIVERIKENLKEIGLKGIYRIVEEKIKQAEVENLSYSEFLDILMEEEIRYRIEKRSNTLLKLANFPFIKTIEEFDFNFQPSIPQATIKEICNLNFIERKENIILLGPPGVGKTHLAIGIGIKACETGKKVYFCDMGNLIKILKEANVKREAFLNKVSLLIIDEVGYFPIDRYESYLFFQLISNKYEKSSIIITSNKSFIEWGDIFSDQALVGAILDRLLHHSIIINIKGQSYRLRNKIIEKREKNLTEK